jgi:hypothetical protein
MDTKKDVVPIELRLFSSTIPPYVPPLRNTARHPHKGVTACDISRYRYKGKHFFSLPQTYNQKVKRRAIRRAPLRRADIPWRASK